MRRNTFRVAAASAVVCALVASSALMAGKFNKQLDVGDKAPTFSDLPGVDGKSKSFDDYKDAKVMVIAFTCNHCPVAVAYEDRFVEFDKQYKDKDVAFVAINVNTIAADKLDKMKERAEKKGFTFDYLYDESQKSGKAYGATVTPHVFVLDQDRKIAYMGRFDDSTSPSGVKDQYVKDAVDALLAGKTPEIAESRQQGCGIQYNN